MAHLERVTRMAQLGIPGNLRKYLEEDTVTARIKEADSQPRITAHLFLLSLTSTTLGIKLVKKVE